MTIDVYDFLSILLYISLIILVIVFILLGIKLIKTLKKVDVVIDDVNDKMEKVDGVFNIIDKTTDYAASISDRVISAISNFLKMFFTKKKGRNKNEQE